MGALSEIFSLSRLRLRLSRHVLTTSLRWSIAFIVAAAIPDYFGFVSVISASTVIQFTYSFPPILALGYNIHMNAMRTAPNGDGYDPATGRVTRIDRGLKRWIRGFSGPWPGPWWANILHFLYAGM